MKCHDVAAFAFVTVSDCDQLIFGPVLARNITLDLLMTDVPDLVRVAVELPIGKSDHSSLGGHFDGTCVLAESFPETPS